MQSSLLKQSQLQPGMPGQEKEKQSNCKTIKASPLSTSFNSAWVSGVTLPTHTCNKIHTLEQSPKSPGVAKVWFDLVSVGTLSGGRVVTLLHSQRGITSSHKGCSGRTLTRAEIIHRLPSETGQEGVEELVLGDPRCAPHSRLRILAIIIQTAAESSTLQGLETLPYPKCQKLGHTFHLDTTLSTTSTALKRGCRGPEAVRSNTQRKKSHWAGRT